jgi:hypothetical protein
MSKTLLFEGAGWSGADSSINSGVGNCRIRTRIRNIDGRLIYLELGGFEYSGKIIPDYAKGLKFVGRVDHCFYCDSGWDDRRNHSTTLNHIENIHYEYNKENILKLVNENLHCDFESIEVINDNSIRVFDTEQPLCDCSKPGYTPFKQIEISIHELDSIKPLQTFPRYREAQYKINYEYVKQLPYIHKHLEERSEQEKQKIPNYTFFFNIRWNQEGIIIELELTAKQNFCSIGFGEEELEDAIKYIKLSNPAITDKTA